MYVNPFIKDLYRVKFHDERRNVLRLDMNENPEGLPASFVEEVLKKITPDFLAMYPEKDRLAALIAKHCDIPVNNLTVTSGSVEAMELAFRCFAKPGAQLLSVVPTFEMYGVYANMFGMEHITVSFKDDFNIDANSLISAVNENTGIIVLLNPNSPIGAVYTEGEVCAIIEKAAENGALVIIDEAYHYFYGQTFMPLIFKYKNVLVLRTFSKLCSIAGLRIGYAAGNSTLIDYLEKAQGTFNVNSTAILFAEEILKRPGIMEKQREIELAGRNFLTRKLRGSGYKTLSLEGNYVLFVPRRSSKEVVAALKEKNIRVRDYGTGVLSGYIRVSTGSVRCMEIFFNALLEADVI